MAPSKPRARCQKSKLTNGTSLFLGDVDGRSAIARRFGDLMHELEFERGGPEAMTSLQRQAVRAYAALCVERERIESDMAMGKTINGEAYGKLCDRMDRQSRRMGLPKAAERRPLAPGEVCPSSRRATPLPS
ncbi:hypothetical protein [Methylobacterium oxalidis]|uniref:Uncharacterized protein n=1 Tax=Methylobacterium oxalidis TaxID=944322 RepID=A0A512JCB0_9HYPH|nr:hypothetical protein [Methylobacterium oxalidis]GEP07610.1 hypothetical protein MOX02_56480 [Methylobacterium oxalidis]GJE33459.1 hypothetical protein LDDCCGHA_3659 [Methylobacterium oxalidis]GLS66194.1 hypothetical protein GCM10007888_45760 [Methylobacterium oxalidis]